MKTLKSFFFLIYVCWGILTKFLLAQSDIETHKSYDKLHMNPLSWTAGALILCTIRIWNTSSQLLNQCKIFSWTKMRESYHRYLLLVPKDAFIVYCSSRALEKSRVNSHFFQCIYMLLYVLFFSSSDSRLNCFCRLIISRRNIQYLLPSLLFYIYSAVLVVGSMKS